MKIPTSTTIDEEKMLDLHPIPPSSTALLGTSSTDAGAPEEDEINADDLFDYESLKLISKPTGPSSPLLSIHNCEGHLDKLPLKS